MSTRGMLQSINAYTAMLSSKAVGEWYEKIFCVIRNLATHEYIDSLIDGNGNTKQIFHLYTLAEYCHAWWIVEHFIGYTNTTLDDSFCFVGSEYGMYERGLYIFIGIGVIGKNQCGGAMTENFIAPWNVFIDDAL